MKSRYIYLKKFLKLCEFVSKAKTGLEVPSEVLQHSEDPFPVLVQPKCANVLDPSWSHTFRCVLIASIIRALHRILCINLSCLFYSGVIVQYLSFDFSTARDLSSGSHSQSVL